MTEDEKKALLEYFYQAKLIVGKGVTFRRSNLDKVTNLT